MIRGHRVHDLRQCSNGTVSCYIMLFVKEVNVIKPCCIYFFPVVKVNAAARRYRGNVVLWSFAMEEKKRNVKKAELKTAQRKVPCLLIIIGLRVFKVLRSNNSSNPGVDSNRLCTQSLLQKGFVYANGRDFLNKQNISGRIGYLSFESHRKVCT